MLTDRPATSPPFPISDRERAQLAQLVDYSSVQSLPEVWRIARSRFGETLALHDPHAKPPVQLTYTQFADQIQQFAAGVQALGLPPIAGTLPPRVALFANNSPQWMIADQGIMAAGAADVVRGADADRHELLFILENSGSTGLVVENLALLKKLRPQIDDLPVQWVVLLSKEEPEAVENLPVQVVNFAQLMTKGANHSLQPVSLNRDTTATLMYTSGTTGKPKGAMLSHGNLLHQLTTLGVVIQPQKGDRVLSILPSWHVYERTGEYFFLSQGCTQIYTNIRYVKKDLQEFKPHIMLAVPRLWESIYEGVRKQFREQPENKQKLVNTLMDISGRYIQARRILQGLTLDPEPPSPLTRLIAGLQTAAYAPIHALGDRLVYAKIRSGTGGQLKYIGSGGGSLALHLENFYEIIGINLLVVYGLTETSPGLTLGRPWRKLRGSAGQPLPGTEIKIVDHETRQLLPVGRHGVVMVRGPQIMQGYFQNPEATRKAIDPEGWFDTGDIGWLTAGNDLVLTGRAKDTIVLTNGENIEPQPIEDACLRSPYIDQIIVVGQDRKSVGALIVPNLEALEKWATSQNLRLHLPESVSQPALEEQPAQEIELDSKIVQELFRQELNREVQNRPGYRPDDRIGPFRLITEPFSIENGMMTQTLKIKRPVVTERYRDTIDGMFA